MLDGFKFFSYGFFSAKIAQTVIPNEYTSLFLPYSSPSNTSGAIKTGVPIASVIFIVFVDKRLVPKSDNFTLTVFLSLENETTKRLSGFKSRWMMSFW